MRRFQEEIARSSRAIPVDEAAAERRLAERGRRIFDLTVAPLKKAMGDCTILLISPDDALNLVPFGALQDEAGRYLIEYHQIHYLSSGRDLLRFPAMETASGGRKDSGAESAIIADPDYDMGVGERTARANELVPGGREIAMRGREPSRVLASTRWPRLPGTRREAEEIRKILSDERTRIYLDRDALNEVVKNVRSPRRLHLATHGFFLEEGERSPWMGAGWQGLERQQGVPPPSSLPMENPLLRSGLVFAGGNQLGKELLPEGSDSGLLTALEVSGMNLLGTDLVVLSACETGLGETRRGEGVFGLRRAFQLAGARTVVMSLWSVPDQQTQELMVNFYGRLKKGERKSEALRNASLEMIRERRSKYGAAHPLFWGAFVSVGEP